MTPAALGQVYDEANKVCENGTAKECVCETGSMRVKGETYAQRSSSACVSPGMSPLLEYHRSEVPEGTLRETPVRRGRKEENEEKTHEGRDTRLLAALHDL